jgi:predicted AAA+ superfamily ATPase
VLSREMKSELRGWPYEVELWPLSFREFCRFRGVDAESPLERERARVRVAFDEFLKYGAMPGVVLEEGVSDKFKKLQGYFDTMLLRDFIEHWSVANPPVLRYFLKRVMAGLASPVSVNAIYNDIKSQGFKATKNDLYDWLDKACGIYLFIRATKYNRSVAKEQQALSKYYVVDNGLRTATLIAQSDDAGRQLENAVFLHLYRNKGGDGKVCYWQGRGECDFAVCRDNEVVRLVQATWSLADAATRRREVAGLLEAAKALDCGDLAIVTHDEEGEIAEGGRTIRVVPAWKLLLG